jgi:SAM-dependent methyltransferase
MKNEYNQNWNAEYESKGIPSSSRTTPSAALTWFLENLSSFTDMPPQNLKVLDVGCGTGRNAIYLASLGFNVKGIDASEVAIKHAREKTQSMGNILLFKHDLSINLPYKEKAFDIIMDIFVYKHQLSFEGRRRYRKEMHRVLKDEGCLLLSLADAEDGYYKNCPALKDADPKNPRTINDPAVDIGSVLFTFEELQNEMADTFSCEKMWRNNSTSEMHGKEYPRMVLTTVWRKK